MVEYDCGEDNECPFCGGNDFYEHITFDPKTLEGTYEYSCFDCNKSESCDIEKIEN